MTFKNRIAVALAAGAAILCPAVRAQQPDAAPAIPPMTCENPGEFPRRQANGPELARFQKKIEQYKVCVDEYARTLGARATDLMTQAKAYNAAANAAIDGYNTYVTAVNEQAKSPH